MKYEEIIKLLDAGYSREDILKMQAEPEDEKESGSDESGSHESGSAEPEVSAVITELKDAITSMKNEIMAMNIMNTRMTDDERTGDDIIAEIINPPKYNKKEGKEK